MQDHPKLRVAPAAMVVPGETATDVQVAPPVPVDQGATPVTVAVGALAPLVT